ncbi:hypothetical protein E8E13_005376 [Curvularia kusanoi]|uniref:Uncharacterized protein n=1 Tax=Curvularia kusanoi TaxID=90978 RepID=A0A9P4T6G5_CURKU|nr:hypothetical protein E8E13_005376 [Curvularia kusanoi]
MAHRALLLPEIVAIILQTGSEEPGLLYNSLLVNRLFFQEASPVLWSTCEIFDAIHPDPRTLGTLVLREDVQHERVQFYASLVQNINFQYDESQVDQHNWHNVLRQLEFPNLKTVCFCHSEDALQLATEDVMLHYIRPGLQKLYIDQNGPLTDDFFDGLTEVCSGLQQVTLRPSKVIASDVSMARSLSNMTNVESLTLDEGFRRTRLEPRILEAIAALPKLETLSLPEVPEESMVILLKRRNKIWFPSLEHLYIGATAGTMELFHQVVPGLKDIFLEDEEFEQTNHVLSVLSRFQSLTCVRIMLSASSTILGDELLRLAQSCPDIENIEIGIESWDPILPSAIGFTDNLIHNLAHSLPKITCLRLIFTSESLPSLVNTLRTLGALPQLKELTFSCRADWRLLLDIPRDAPLGQFTHLTFLVDEHMRQSFDEKDYPHLLEIWKDNAAIWLPRVILFQIPHADDWEEAFTQVLDPDELLENSEIDGEEIRC